jgi:excisionase family DNA binding protein
MGVVQGQLSLDLETAASPPPEQDGDAARRTSRRRSRARARSEHATAGRELLSVSEVSRITGLSANAVYRAIWSGELCASKLRGRLRVQKSDVEAWVVAGRVAPPRAEPQPPPRACRRRPAGPGRGLRELLQTDTPPVLSRQTRLDACSHSERR